MTKLRWCRHNEKKAPVNLPKGWKFDDFPKSECPFDQDILIVPADLGLVCLDYDAEYQDKGKIKAFITELYKRFGKAFYTIVSNAEKGRVHIWYSIADLDLSSKLGLEYEGVKFDVIHNDHWMRVVDPGKFKQAIAGLDTVKPIDVGVFKSFIAEHDTDEITELSSYKSDLQYLRKGHLTKKFRTDGQSWKNLRSFAYSLGRRELQDELKTLDNLVNKHATDYGDLPGKLKVIHSAYVAGSKDPLRQGRALSGKWDAISEWIGKRDFVLDEYGNLYEGGKKIRPTDIKRFCGLILRETGARATKADFFDMVMSDDNIPVVNFWKQWVEDCYERYSEIRADFHLKAVENQLQVEFKHRDLARWWSNQLFLRPIKKFFDPSYIFQPEKKQLFLLGPPDCGKNYLISELFPKQEWALDLHEIKLEWESDSKKLQENLQGVVYKNVDEWTIKAGAGFEKWKAGTTKRRDMNRVAYAEQATGQNRSYTEIYTINKTNRNFMTCLSQEGAKERIVMLPVKRSEQDDWIRQNLAKLWASAYQWYLAKKHLAFPERTHSAVYDRIQAAGQVLIESTSGE